MYIYNIWRLRRNPALKSQSSTDRCVKRDRFQGEPADFSCCQRVYLFSIYETRNKVGTPKARGCAWPIISIALSMYRDFWIFFYAQIENASLELNSCSRKNENVLTTSCVFFGLRKTIHVFLKYLKMSYVEFFLGYYSNTVASSDIRKSRYSRPQVIHTRVWIPVYHPRDR